MNEDQCLCFNQGATLRPIKDTAYFCSKCPVPLEETTAATIILPVCSI